MNAPLVFITGLPDEGAHAMPEYWRAIAARDKCRRCGVPKTHASRVDGPIPLFEGTRSMLAPVWYLQPKLIGAELYAMIRGDLPPHWTWKVIPDVRSVQIGHVGVLVRPRHRPMTHAPGYAPQLCSLCGESKYPKGLETYVVRSTLPDFPITQSRHGGLIAEKALAERLRKRFPRKLRITPLDVLEAAPQPVIV